MGEKTQKLFGTDGVRGVVNQYPMTPEVALRLGKALAKVFRDAQDIKTVLIGKDTRLSGYMFETALTAGITSMGLDVYLVGPLPTPAVAHLTKSFNANAGIMISASHNPAGDNGIKIFSEKGMKLSDEKEAEIEREFFSDSLEESCVEPHEVGRVQRLDEAHGRYVEFAKSTVKYQDLAGLKVVLDCANGAAYAVAPKIFGELGVDLTVIFDQPNGRNINSGCGATHVEALAEEVLACGADIGIALDGDADRIIVVDEKGAVVDGDQILCLAALRMKREGRLNNNAVVTTVMSNLGLKLLMREHDIDVVVTGVGDRYVIEELVKHDHNLGGEQSGHIIFSEHNLTGDGIIAGLQVLSMMKNSGEPISSLASVMTKAPQALINLRVKEKPAFSSLPEVSAAMEAAEASLGEDGRLLVRYSGTEPIARVLVEGVDEEKVKTLAESVGNALKDAIGE